MNSIKIIDFGHDITAYLVGMTATALATVQSLESTKLPEPHQVHS